MVTSGNPSLESKLFWHVLGYMEVKSEAQLFLTSIGSKVMGVKRSNFPMHSNGTFLCQNIQMHQNWHSCRSWWVKQKSQSQHRSNRYQTRENEFPKFTYYSGLLDPIMIYRQFEARFVKVMCRFELCPDWLFCSTSQVLQLCQIWAKLVTWPKMSH